MMSADRSALDHEINLIAQDRQSIDEQKQSLEKERRGVREVHEIIKAEQQQNQEKQDEVGMGMRVCMCGELNEVHVCAFMDDCFWVDQVDNSRPHYSHVCVACIGFL